MKLKWTVEFQVDTRWVKDGFDLDNDKALDMLSNTLSFAHTGTELKAKVLTAPDKKLIKKLQGY